MNPPPVVWPPKDDDDDEEKEEEIRFDFAGIGYDKKGRIIEVPEGWEVEFTGTVSGYTGGKDNPFEEERITLLGAPGTVSEKDLMQQYKDEGHPTVYYAGEEIVELESFSERAVEKKETDE